MLSRCHTLVRATKSPSQGGAFSDQRCGWSLWQIYGMPYKKNTEVEVLQVGDLSKGSAFFFFFGGRCSATQVCAVWWRPNSHSGERQRHDGLKTSKAYTAEHKKLFDV